MSTATIADMTTFGTQETAVKTALATKEAELSAARTQLQAIQSPDDAPLAAAAAARHLEDLLASNAKEADLQRAEAAFRSEQEKYERARSETEQTAARARMRVTGLERQRDGLLANLETLGRQKRDALRRFMEGEMDAAQTAYLAAIDHMIERICDIEAVWRVAKRLSVDLPNAFTYSGTNADFPALLGREHRQGVRVTDIDAATERRMAAFNALL